MIVLLGEVGGTEEYDVCEALKDGRINKPLVAWCIGTCAGKCEYSLNIQLADAAGEGVLHSLKKFYVLKK
jgi:ATP citrate (pro-S)-lyase